MKAAIQKLLGLAIEQDAKVKIAVDTLASAKNAVLIAERALAEAMQIAADYRSAHALLARPVAVPAPVEAEKPARKRA